jgi:hypothetical protein
MKKMKNLSKHISCNNEDIPVIDFLNQLDRNKEYNLIEIGSGLCRFVDIIKSIYPNIKITCFELNENSAKIALAKGFNTINENILQNTLKTEEYDIVHCSHVIEHFNYPAIITVIDNLLRITKKDGYCIIRSPLMWESFYDDIDHVRIYPPSAILNYLHMEQQQEKGKNKIDVVSIWYRTLPKQYKYIDKSYLLYGLPFIRKILNRIIQIFNKIFIKLWNRYRYPASNPNGYIMIMKKIS